MCFLELLVIVRGSTAERPGATMTASHAKKSLLLLEKRATLT
jgi:hypothetical protein